jgi:hypothetical protein
MTGKVTLAAAALAALGLSGCAATNGEGGGGTVSMMGRTSAPAPAASTADKKGECWGVNACKGQGACGGVGHDCAGQNACKGQGWLSLTKDECDGRKGKFKAG